MTTGKFSSVICDSNASRSCPIWDTNCEVPGSSLPSVARFRWLIANLHVFVARAMSGHVSLRPASQAASPGRSAVCRATRWSGSFFGAQPLAPEYQPSACSLPPSDFLRKHFFAPSCSPKVQCVHSALLSHARAQIPMSSAMNLSVSLQLFCQQPATPCSLASTKTPCSPACRSTVPGSAQSGNAWRSPDEHGQASRQTL
mmetsp:Transcript_42415/g.113984  ORF Transcript_42415/g.113984 Transcript_42415/m.113984 type:complete len:200 (+) Transcript_42415:328-927(+)